MKLPLICPSWILFTLATLTMNLAQETQDVVYLKDGSRLVGTIVTLVPDKSVTVRTSDGTVYVLEWSRVDRISKEPGTAAAPKKQFKPGLEPWYAYWGIGYASTSYPEDIRTYIDGIERLHNPGHTSIAADMFGFYWPLRDDKTLLGFIVAGSLDQYSYENESVDFNHYLYSGSVVHFFGEIPGDGLFLRADLGFAMLSEKMGGIHHSGVGFLLGGGFGFPVSIEARILVQTGYVFRHLGSGNSGTWSLTAGCLF